jgi:hypothetical protein
MLARWHGMHQRLMISLKSGWASCQRDIASKYETLTHQHSFLHPPDRITIFTDDTYAVLQWCISASKT